MSSKDDEAKTYQPGVSKEEYEREYGSGPVTKLGSNESPFGPSERVLEAVFEAAATLNRYPPVSDESLRDLLAELHDVAPEQIVTGNGGADVLSMIAYALLDASSSCVVSRPTFPVYEMTARRQGARIDYVDLDPESFAPNPTAILKAVRPDTRIVYVCSPNNPTGTLFPHAGFIELLANLPGTVVVVADEVYMPFSEVDDSLGLISDHPNLIVLQSFSKTRGLAGARVGYAVGSPAVVERVAAHRLPFHTNSLSVVAAHAALADHGAVEELVAHVRAERDRMARRLRDAGYTTWPTHANFLCVRTPDETADLGGQLMRRRIIVRPLEGFSLPGHIRITVGTVEENDRVLAALEELR